MIADTIAAVRSDDTIDDIKQSFVHRPELFPSVLKTK